MSFKDYSHKKNSHKKNSHKKNSPKNQSQKKSIVFMFPGQGCQFYHMGRELYQNNDIFSKWMNHLDQIVQQQSHFSILGEIYNDQKARSHPFDNILFSHPAIFMIEYALAKTLIEQHVQPDYLLGASLGEIVGLTLSDVLSLNEGLSTVLKQAELFHNKKTPENEGAMLAILAGEEYFQNTPTLNQTCEIAAYNAESLIVIAGPISAIVSAEAFLRAQDVIFQRLPVCQAFHTPGIKHLKSDLLTLFAGLTFRKPQIPLYSCQSTERITDMDAKTCWSILRKPIEFSKTLKHLEAQAKQSNEQLVYIDLGPTGTLANLVKQNLRDHTSLECYTALSPFGRDLDAFEKILISSPSLQATGSDSNTQTLTPVKPQLQPNARIDSPDLKLIQPEPSKAPEIKNTPKPEHTPRPKDALKQLYVFPGQGSQYLGMGQELFDEFPQEIATADSLLGYSIRTLCLQDPQQQLSNTEFTQPALYTVNALTYLKQLKTQRFPPDFLAGHSLGEYNALFAAGVFNFETGLKLVQKRGALMAQASGGGMAAIIGQPSDSLKTLLEQHQLTTIDIANYNSSNQTVLSGPKEALNQAAKVFQDLNITFIPLKVSAPFHSRYMESVKLTFLDYLRTFEFSQPKIPVISNVTARPYQGNDILENLSQQICGSVRWLDSIHYVKNQGLFEYKELGPGNVLSKLITNICQ